LELYSEITLSRKPFGIGHMYIYNFMLRKTNNVTSENIGLSSWDTLYIYIYIYIYNLPVVFLSENFNLSH
jgi:hypothetical protein